MSILTDVVSRKITFATAVAEAVQWVQNLVKNNPAAEAAAGAALASFKQAASNAITLGGTALGDILTPASMAVEVATNVAIAKAIGPGAVALTPAVDSGIDNLAAALHAEIDAAVLKAKAALAPAPAASGNG